MPLHPEIQHIATVLEHVRDRKGLPTSNLRFIEKTHQKGDTRLKGGRDKLTHYALAIWENANKSGTGKLPNYIRNYMIGQDGKGPSMQWAFRVLEHVGRLDSSLVRSIAKAPQYYGPDAMPRPKQAVKRGRPRKKEKKQKPPKEEKQKIELGVNVDALLFDVYGRHEWGQEKIIDMDEIVSKHESEIPDLVAALEKIPEDKNELAAKLVDAFHKKYYGEKE